MKFWELVEANHLFPSGGPCGRGEHFAAPADFSPDLRTEVCVATTWMQLSLALNQLTGQARFARAAEVTALNQLLGSQSPDGAGWCTHPAANQPKKVFQTRLSCRMSSGNRGLEMFASHLLAEVADPDVPRLVFNSYLPATVHPARTPGVRRVTVTGHYPFHETAEIELELAGERRLAMDFLLPSGARSLRVTVGGRQQTLQPLPSGYFQLEREWREGDRAVVRFDFPLRAHRRRSSDGTEWVAFTRGPLALACETVESSPRLTVAWPGRAEGPVDAGRLLERLAAANPDTIEYQLRGLPVKLMPYYRAGSTGAGYQLFRSLQPRAAARPGESP